MKPETILDNYALLPGPIEVELLQVLGGANYFSGGPVVLMRINLHEFDEVYTNNIKGFFESLSGALPSLIEHHCSEGVRGGFFMRVLDGTLLGHVIEHTAIELQTLAGMDVNYGKTRSTLQAGVYNVIFRFKDKFAGLYAGKAAANLINSILLGIDFNVQDVINQLIGIREDRLLGPSTQHIVDAAVKSNIPWIRLDDYNLIQLGSGKYQKRLRSTLSSDTSAIAAENVRDRVLSLKMLADAGIPVAKIIDLHAVSENDLPAILTFAQRTSALPDIKIPVVYNTNIKTIIYSFDPKRQLLLLKQKAPCCWRYLCIGGKISAVSYMVPPSVKGDAIHCIDELVANLNADPQREIGDKGKLGKFIPDGEFNFVLTAQNIDLQSIPEKDRVVWLAGTANPKNGSSSIAYDGVIHSHNQFIIEKTARIMGLDIAGIDVHGGSPDLAFEDSGAFITEVFAAPNLRAHIKPSMGKPADVASAIIKLLFPPGSPNHIPLISVTGSSGKTSCINFINDCLIEAGYYTGSKSSSGLCIGSECFSNQSFSSHKAVSILLQDPDINCALIETSIEDISQYGLGYDLADYGIVLNVQDTDVEKSGFHCLEDLSYAKSVVVEEVYDHGLSILNADDPMILAMLERCPANIALFSANGNRIDQSIAPKIAIQAGVEGNKIVVKLLNKQEIISYGPLSVKCMDSSGLVYDSILAAVVLLHHMAISDQIINKHLEQYQM